MVDVKDIPTGDTMTQEKQDPRGLSEEVLKKIAANKLEERADKEAWLIHHKERHPVYPSTNEDGSFVGLFGYATTVGARIFPYYRTQSGTYFYEWEDTGRKQKKTLPLDLKKIQREKSAIFYTPKSFLGDEPVAEPGVIPTRESQAETPRTAK